MFDIGVRRLVGINVLIIGNVVMFERLKIILCCNFNVIIELFNFGILYFSGSIS